MYGQTLVVTYCDSFSSWKLQVKNAASFIIWKYSNEQKQIKVVIIQKLYSIILEVFPNLNDSVIPWKYFNQT